jgi:hypothetical protein
MRLPFLLVALALPLSCKDGETGGKDSGREQEPHELSFWPPEAGRGTTFTAKITAGASIFEFGNGGLTLGKGVTVDTFTVVDGWTATATITVAADAELGARTAEIDSSKGDFSIADALTVVDDSFSIYPDRAKIGESVEVEFIGQNTAWTPGAVWAGFGEGIDVNAVDVLSETYMLAEVTVSPDAVPGLRDVFVEEGPDLTTQYNAFQVDRVGVSALFDPPEVTQGDTVQYTITGKDTHFSADSEIHFYQAGDEKEDIVIDTMNVENAELITGKLTVSNAAELGTRDVLVVTDEEGVFIEDATNVVDADIDLSLVGISRWFNVLRGIDNTTGAISESVSVGVIFFLPLDPPCPPDPETACGDWYDNDEDGYTDCYDSDCSTDPACGGGPQPYDSNGVFETYSSSGAADCPANETVSAGEHVWLESDCNIVTLDRQVDGSSGMIYYSADVTLPDYCFDQSYTLHTEGEDGAIPEAWVDEIIYTVPADYSLLEPEWWGGYTHNRAEDLTYTWTPAETSPPSYFITSISGALVDPPGAVGYVGSIPRDDGEHTYTSDELSYLDAGPATFAAYSIIFGPEVGFTFSSIQTDSQSYVYTSGSLVLE